MNFHEIRTHLPAKIVMAIVVAAFSSGDLVADEPVALEGHDEYVYMISFSRNGKLMATAAGDNRAIVWQLENQA